MPKIHQKQSLRCLIEFFFHFLYMNNVNFFFRKLYKQYIVKPFFQQLFQGSLKFEYILSATNNLRALNYLNLKNRSLKLDHKKQSYIKIYISTLIKYSGWMKLTFSENYRPVPLNERVLHILTQIYSTVSRIFIRIGFKILMKL